MACKIERVVTPSGFVVFRVSGRIDREYAEVLQELIENEKTAEARVALDLTEVTVVSLEAVRAFNVSEANGIELRNCPAYVREWISQVRKCGLRE
ncbi:MAG TPA: STAS domain-containing protein [Candidatus Polarisedimenticolia bacterium]|nr:STAS domain-containing protein [Candidatus Polarisedimenticolia bacterium]